MTSTSVAIAWSTDEDVVGEVDFGLDLDYGITVSESSPSRSHRVELVGLDPGTLYFYQVRASDLVLASGRRFRTLPTAAQPSLRFAAFGDSGAGTPAQADVAARVLEANPDLVVHTGDVVYEAGEPEHFDPYYFEPYASLIDHIPFFTSLGNHDVVTRNAEPYLEAFHLPRNNPESTERYYSFDAANAHFVALDSNQSLAPGSAQRAWLEADLAQPADWKIVYFHHPPFSSALHGSDLDLRAELEPLFLATGVDLVLNGHDHDYERTFPLHNGMPVDEAQEPDYVSPAGVFYVVTGGGGRSLYALETVNAFTAAFRSTFHFTRVDIAGQTLTLAAIDADGVEFDAMTVTK
jgi:hypothetical protein